MAEEDNKIDIASTKQTFNKMKENSIQEINKIYPYFKKYGFLLLILIPLILNFYLRLQAAELPITDIWARDTIINNVRSDVQRQVSQEYPNLPEANKAPIIDQRINSIISQNKAQYDLAIQQLSSEFKAQMKDSHGATYLVGIDPYFWDRHARNILNNGHPGDKLVDGEWYDTHMLAPTGRFVPPDMFHSYFLAYSYKLTTLFNRNATLESVTFYNPAILIGIATILAFFIGRRIAGNVTGFFASTIIAIHGAILVRTTGGFSDTDPYQVLFPILILWIFLESFNVWFHAKHFWIKIILPILTGFLVGFYSFVWGGWWYILLYMLAAGGLYLLLYLPQAWKLEKFKGLISGTRFSAVFGALSLILITSLISLTIFSGPSKIIQLGQFVQGFIEIHDVQIANVWPNVYITVAEQNEGTIQSAISTLGGNFLFYFSVLGILLPLLFRKVRHDLNIDIKYPIIMVIWLSTTIWAVTRGVRFTLMAVPPFAIGFGMGINMLGYYLKKLVIYLNVSNKWYKFGATVTAFVIGLLLLGLLPLQNSGIWPGSRDTAYYGVTDMNDAWWAALEKIKINSSQDAIITSWWDFGHWFKYIADRKVTFDGTSQGNPQAHWVGKILQTDDERYAAGILRMLDCSGQEGGTKAFDLLNKRVQDVAKTRDNIDPIFKMNKEQAREYLKQLYQPVEWGETSLLGKSEIDEMLEYTHCNPPEAYFIASADMVGKSGVWGHFGLWDFNRSLMYNELLDQKYRENTQLGITFLEERFNLSSEEAQKLYYQVISFSSDAANTWISSWPGYRQANVGCTPNENKTILECGNGLVLNLTQIPYTVYFRGNPTLPVYSLVYPSANGSEEQIYTETSDVSIILYEKPTGEIYYAISNKQIANGLFTRMFFMGGSNLTYFEPFDYQRSFNGFDIYVYKVNWNKLMEEDKNG